MTKLDVDQSWIGVDLDGTLSHYTDWIPGGGIGKPIPVMVDRVRAWLSEGRSVRIFTARISFEGIRARAGTSMSYTAAETATIAEIQAWCKMHIGTTLPVTCYKDIHMTELWDDRCVSVTPNTGLGNRHGQVV